MKFATHYDAADDVVVELKDRVRHECYTVDPHEVADAVLRDVAAAWAGLRTDRARARAAYERPARRLAS